MSDPTNPLTEEHLQTIIAGMDKIKSAQAQIQRAKMAGIDVSALEAQVTDAQDKLTRIRQVYFPGR